MSELKRGWNKSTHVPPGKNRDLNNWKMQKRKKRNRNFYLENKPTVCDKCGYSNDKKPWHFEFHHKNSSKNNIPVIRLVNAGKTLSLIKKEIAKCRILCLLCHADEHKRWRVIK